MGSDGIHPHPIQWLGCGTLLELIDRFQFGRREEYLSEFGIVLYDDYARYKNFEMVILVKKED